MEFREIEKMVELKETCAAYRALYHTVDSAKNQLAFAVFNAGSQDAEIFKLIQGITDQLGDLAGMIKEREQKAKREASVAMLRIENQFEEK